jgi:hypothetical protein
MLFNLFLDNSKLPKNLIPDKFAGAGIVSIVRNTGPDVFLFLAVAP